MNSGFLQRATPYIFAFIPIVVFYSHFYVVYPLSLSSAPKLKLQGTGLCHSTDYHGNLWPKYRGMARALSPGDKLGPIFPCIENCLLGPFGDPAPQKRHPGHAPYSTVPLGTPLHVCVCVRPCVGLCYNPFREGVPEAVGTLGELLRAAGIFGVESGRKPLKFKKIKFNHSDERSTATHTRQRNAIETCVIPLC